MNCIRMMKDRISLLYLGMKHFAPLCITLLLLVLSLNCLAQKSPAFSKPDLRVEDGYLLISYDILESQRAERYHVRIEVTDSNGKYIKPTSVTGDIGENVYGGTNKLIKWTLGADNISMDYCRIIVY